MLSETAKRKLEGRLVVAIDEVLGKAGEEELISMKAYWPQNFSDLAARSVVNMVDVMEQSVEATLEREDDE